MISANNYNRIENWVNQCLSRGKFSFSLNEIKDAFPNDTSITMKFGLNRLVQKEKVVSVCGHDILQLQNCIHQSILCSVFQDRI